MNEKLNSAPDYNHQSHESENDLNVENRDFLDKHGKLQVAVYDFASHSVEKFKLAKHDFKESLQTPKEIWRELAIIRAQAAYDRAQERVNKAKFARVKDRRQAAANQAEIRLLELETAVDQDETAFLNGKQGIKQSFEDERDINFSQQRNRYQSILTNKALKNEGLDFVERSEMVGELTKDQARDIGSNALFTTILERRYAKIESQLESELDPDKIDELTARRDEIASKLDGFKQDLTQAIADAFNSELPVDPEPESEPEKKPADQSEQEPESTEEKPTEDESADESQKSDGADGQPSEEPDNEGKEPESKAQPESEKEPEETPEQKQARLEAQRNQKRTKLLQHLELIDSGYSYTDKTSEADQPRIEKLTGKLFGEESHRMVLAGKTFGQWVGANRETWNNLSQKQRDQREDAWPLLVDWYKQ